MHPKRIKGGEDDLKDLDIVEREPPSESVENLVSDEACAEADG